MKLWGSGFALAVLFFSSRFFGQKPDFGPFLHVLAALAVKNLFCTENRLKTHLLKSFLSLECVFFFTLQRSVLGFFKFYMKIPLKNSKNPLKNKISKASRGVKPFLVCALLETDF